MGGQGAYPNPNPNPNPNPDPDPNPNPHPNPNPNPNPSPNPNPHPKQVASRTGSLVETVLTSRSGSPLFCLAYVMPLHCHGARHGTTAVAFLDVHHSLPYMQKQMEARQIADCDLYTFVKFSLLNCLVTDPSSPTPTPAQRNPIVFASAGFSAMSGATEEECLGRNCRFLQVAAVQSKSAQAMLERLCLKRHKKLCLGGYA